MRLTTTLGNLTFVDDTPTQVADPSFKQLLAIEGEELADFSYETFNPLDEATFPGYNSAVKLRTGSLVFTVMPEPIARLMVFLQNLSRLKAIYDRASEAAMERAAQVTRMHYDVVVKTPILVLPQNGLTVKERLILRTGQVNAKNKYGKTANDADKIEASLSGVEIVTEGANGRLQILDNVDLSFDHEQFSANKERAAGQKIRGRSNDIHMSLTQKQYILAMELLQTLPKAFTGVEETDSPESSVSVTPIEATTPGGQATPPLTSPPQDAPKTLDAGFEVPSIRLELFGPKAITEETLKKDSIAAFAINKIGVKYRSEADGASRADVVVKAISMSNTRPGNFVYREMIPEGKRKGNQL